MEIIRFGDKGLRKDSVEQLTYLRSNDRLKTGA